MKNFFNRIDKHMFLNGFLTAGTAINLIIYAKNQSLINKMRKYKYPEYWNEDYLKENPAVETKLKEFECKNSYYWTRFVANLLIKGIFNINEATTILKLLGYKCTNEPFRVTPNPDDTRFFTPNGGIVTDPGLAAKQIVCIGHGLCVRLKIHGYPRNPNEARRLPHLTASPSPRDIKPSESFFAEMFKLTFFSALLEADKDRHCDVFDLLNELLRATRKLAIAVHIQSEECGIPKAPIEKFGIKREFTNEEIDKLMDFVHPIIKENKIRKMAEK